MSIPKILFRTVPEETTAFQEEMWNLSVETVGPDWQHITYRDGEPDMNPNLWFKTGDLWDQCSSGAHKADLIRLEAMYRHGGVYIDSDVEVLHSLDPLLKTQGFAGWEDSKNIPNAMFGASFSDRTVAKMLEKVTSDEWFAKGVWWSGPGLFNYFLQNQGSDWLLLPPGSLYPYHYNEKTQINLVTQYGRRQLEERINESPWAYAVHHWNHSWKGAPHDQS